MFEKFPVIGKHFIECEIFLDDYKNNYIYPYRCIQGTCEKRNGISLRRGP